MKISAKLIIAFAAVALMALLVGVIGITQLTNINSQHIDLYENYGNSQGLIGQINTEFLKWRMYVRDMVLDKDPAKTQTYSDKIKEGDEAVETTLSQYEKLCTLPAEQQNFKDLKAAIEAYKTYRDNITKLSVAGSYDEAYTVLRSTDSTNASSAADKLISSTVTSNIDVGTKTSTALSTTVSGVIWLLIVIVAVAVIGATLLGLLLSQSISKSINAVVKAAKQLSAGDTNVNLHIKSKDETAELANAVSEVSASLKMMIADANMLSAAAIEGKLATRADATAHQGDYRKIVEGVNNTLDAVIGPLNVAANYVDRISKGDVPEKITDSYNGDFNVIKKNLNTCIDAINKLVADADMLSIAAVEGKLATRADASKHHGDFRKIVDGVNQTLDSVINPINETVSVMKLVSTNDYTKSVTGTYAGVPKELADTVNSTIERLLSVQNVFTHLADGDTSLLESYEKIGKRSENDKILPAAIQVMRIIDALVGEATMLSSEAISGNLDTRGNAEKFKGKYKQLIQGINNTLDAMSRPLVEAIAVLDNMAADDYTLDMSEEYNGAFKNLSISVNHVQETLNRTLNDINVAAEQVAAGTQQVSAGSQALSQGATEQASAIEQLTASVSEIASQTKQNAMNANQASELALTARDNAVDGNTKMKEMQQAMTGINEASASISKIIKVIDEIAFQTNLLALNAAVEAARAGQHGKGFAVVAEEVRNLAQRSAGAAKETTSMIEESIKKVKAGTEMADETAQALDKIVIGVEKATNLVGGIAKASNDQATAVSQINRGIEQVSQVVQTNSATAEESAAASEELTSQAELLKDMVGKFSLKGQQLQSGKQKAALRQQRSAGNAGGDKQSSKPRISMSTAEFGKY